MGPERRAADNLDVIESVYRELTAMVARGALVLAGQGYQVTIPALDAKSALEEIETRLSQVRDEEPLGSWELLEGRCTLAGNVVRDLVRHRHQP